MYISCSSTAYPDVDVRVDPEPELAAWTCHHSVPVPVLGAERLPVSSGSQTPPVAWPNRAAAVRTPVRRRTPPVAGLVVQSSAFRRVDDVAFCRCRDAENGWSTSLYAEHYRRHCTVENVGSSAVGERTLADLDPGDDPYLRQLLPTGYEVKNKSAFSLSLSLSTKT